MGRAANAGPAPASSATTTNMALIFDDSIEPENLSNPRTRRTANPRTREPGNPRTLLRAQRDQRVYPHRAAGRHVAGEKGDRREEDRDANEVDRIGRAHVHQLGLNDRSDEERANRADDHADQREPDALHHDEAEHVASPRAERHA